MAPKPALTALAQLLGQLLATVGGIIGWVAVAHYWLDISTQIALLAFIAFAVAGRSAVLTQKQQAPEPEALPERDFYVVTHDRYRWDLARSRLRRPTTKPELGGTIFAYDTFAAAELKYRQLEAEQQPLDLEGRDFSYHEIYGYDEEETRLWVVYARSKTEAHDKLFYDDSRRFLGHDGRTDDLLLVTDNEPRKEQYLEWSGPLYQAAFEAERKEVEAKMRYDAAAALFGFKELPPPNSIRCEEAAQFRDKLQSKYNELHAAITEWRDRAALMAARTLIWERIEAARACGKYALCTIHAPKAEANA
jgi:hypothetical protein